jgi:hypothetical protein
MNNKKLYQWIFVLILAALLLAGCGGATAKSPAPGEWVATTNFGKLVFTVDATGSKITKMSYQFSNWTCGPTTNSGTIEASSEWPITDGKFSIDENLDPDGNQTMNFVGTYSAADQKFSGTWDEISYGSKCSGTWEATAPK